MHLHRSAARWRGVLDERRLKGVAARGMSLTMNSTVTVYETRGVIVLKGNSGRRDGYEEFIEGKESRQLADISLPRSTAGFKIDKHARDGRESTALSAFSYREDGAPPEEIHPSMRLVCS